MSFAMGWDSKTMGNEEAIKPLLNSAVSGTKITPEIQSGVDLYNNIIGSNVTVSKLAKSNFRLAAWLLGRCDFAFSIFNRGKEDD